MLSDKTPPLFGAALMTMGLIGLRETPTLLLLFALTLNGLLLWALLDRRALIRRLSALESKAGAV